MKTIYKDLNEDIKEFLSSLKYSGVILGECGSVVYLCFSVDDFLNYCTNQTNHKKLYYRGCECEGELIYNTKVECSGIGIALEWVYIESEKPTERQIEVEKEVKLVNRKAR
jgi:hypothetical protein